MFHCRPAAQGNIDTLKTRSNAMGHTGIERNAAETSAERKMQTINREMFYGSEEALWQVATSAAMWDTVTWQMW